MQEAGKENWEQTNLLIVGKAYPEVSRKYTETVCTGAVTQDGKLVRLYPIPFRYLASERKFPTWSLIQGSIMRNLQDPRIESYKVNAETIKVLQRKVPDLEKAMRILPLVRADHFALADYYRQFYGSLSFLRAEPLEFHWEKGDEDWKAQQQAVLKQLRLFGEQPKQLEKIPWVLKLRFRCWNCVRCRGHNQRLLTWNVYEGFRKFRIRYSGEQQAKQKVVEQLWRIFRPAKHCYLLLSTHRRYPVWMIGAYFCATEDIVREAQAVLSSPKLFN